MGECLIIRSGGGTDTSGATATASVVLAGYTCYVNDNKITGSMPAQTLNRTLNAGGSVTIPAGYYDGSSVISTSTLAGETAANAASSHILSGYNAWVNGSKINGSMANRGNISHSLPANGSYTIPAGWHAGGGVVNQSLAFHWGGTYTPNTANQVICWANWYATGNIVVLGSSALTAGNIRNGVWIFGVLGNFTGWVDSTMNVNAIWPLNYGPDYTEYWANNDDWTSLWAVQYGYALISNGANGISVGQQLWNMGFRWVNLSASLSAFDQSGVCDGSIVMQWDAWGYGVSSGNVVGYSHTNYVLNPKSGQPTANRHGGWSIGSGTKVGATATFTLKINLKITNSSGTASWWVSSAGVYIHMKDVARLSAGMLKLNSFNFYFSKS